MSLVVFQTFLKMGEHYYYGIYEAVENLRLGRSFGRKRKRKSGFENVHGRKECGYKREMQRGACMS
jgi:hypothetical protein